MYLILKFPLPSFTPQWILPEVLLNVVYSLPEKADGPAEGFSCAGDMVPPSRMSWLLPAGLQPQVSGDLSSVIATRWPLPFWELVPH